LNSPRLTHSRMPSKSSFLPILSILLFLLPAFSFQNFLTRKIRLSPSHVSLLFIAHANPEAKNIHEAQSTSLNRLCDPSHYLYSDGTCSPLCELPNTRTTQNGVPFCKISSSEVTSNQLRSLEQDPVATSNPSSNSIQYWNSLINSEPVSNIASSLTFFSYLVQPANPGPLVQILSSQIPTTLKYLNINYHNDLKDLLDSPSSNSIKMNLLGFDMPAPWKNHFISTETLIYNSNYLVNDFKNLITYMLILALIGAFGITTYVRNKLKLEGKSLSEHLYTAFKWNIALVVFFSGLSELFLFSSIEISSFKSQRFFNIISLLACLLMIGIAFLVMIKLLRITQEARKASLSLEAFRNKNKALRILFAGFSSNSLLNQRCLLFYLLRTITVSVIIIPLYDYPIAQASVNLIMGCAMMIFLVKRRPFMNKLNLIQSIVLETQLLLINLSILALAINDEAFQNISALLKGIIFTQNITIKSFVVISFLYNIFQTIKQRSEKNPKEIKISNSLKLETIQEEEKVDQENENDNIRLFIGVNSNFTTPRNSIPTSQMTQTTQWKKLRISGMIDLDLESDVPVPRTTRRHRHTQSGEFEPSDSQREAFTRSTRRVRTMKDQKRQDHRGYC